MKVASGYEYVLTKATLKWLKSHGFNCLCKRCRNPLKVGQRVVSRLVSRKLKTVSVVRRNHYHKDCLESMYH